MDAVRRTDWVRHARWQLGEITNGEYAKELIDEGGDPEADVLISILLSDPDRRQRKPERDV
jgi:hypothetical protein